MDSILRIMNMNEHYFHYPIDTFLQSQQKLGQKHMVFWTGVPHLWVDQYGPEPHEIIFEKIFKAGIQIDAIIARPYNYTLFMEEDSVIRKHSIAYYHEMIDLAAEQKIPFLGIELWGALRDIGWKQQFRNCRNALRELCAYAEKKKVKLMVGNVSYDHSATMNTLGEIQHLIEEVEGKLLVALDYGAAWLQNESVSEWFRIFGEKIALIYLSNARNGSYGYPLNLGCYPVWKEIKALMERNYPGMTVLRMSQDICKVKPDLVDWQNWSYIEKHYVKGA